MGKELNTIARWSFEYPKTNKVVNPDFAVLKKSLQEYSKKNGTKTHEKSRPKKEAK